MPDRTSFNGENMSNIERLVWGVNLLEAKEGLGVGDVPELVDGGVAVGGAAWIHHCPSNHSCDLPQSSKGEGDIFLAEWQRRGASKDGKEAWQGEGARPHPVGRLGGISWGLRLRRVSAV